MKKYSIGEFSKLIGKTTQTLRNWDKNGKLKPEFIDRDNGYRYYSHKQLSQFNNDNLLNNRITIGYCRVSSRKQKEALDRQIKIVSNSLEKANNKFDIISDIGSGIKYDKKGLLDLIQRVINNEVDKIVILHKDRLVRFGFELIENICSLYDVEIEILEDDTKSIEEEVIKDLIQIITVFSCRLQGKRGKRVKDIIKVIEDDKNN